MLGTYDQPPQHMTLWRVFLFAVAVLFQWEICFHPIHPTSPATVFWFELQDAFTIIWDALTLFDLRYDIIFWPPFPFLFHWLLEHSKRWGSWKFLLWSGSVMSQCTANLNSSRNNNFLDPWLCQTKGYDYVISHFLIWWPLKSSKDMLSRKHFFFL